MSQASQVFYRPSMLASGLFSECVCSLVGPVRRSVRPSVRPSEARFFALPRPHRCSAFYREGVATRRRLQSAKTLRLHAAIRSSAQSCNVHASVERRPEPGLSAFERCPIGDFSKFFPIWVEKFDCYIGY